MAMAQRSLSVTDQAELQRLREENERLKARVNQPLRCKVSEKGALSVYGLGRWPTSLYLEQWLRLAEAMPMVVAFIEENRGKLSTKGA